MYVYRLKKYLLDKRRLKGWSGNNGYLSSEYTHEIYPEGNYAEHTALSWFSDVVIYSKVLLRKVPARNGILLPVRFFDEEEV